MSDMYSGADLALWDANVIQGTRHLLAGVAVYPGATYG